MQLFKLAFFFLYLAAFNKLSFAQQQVTLKGQKETVYPIDLKQINQTNDLLPLKTILQEKSVIGMGEATHGTKEFFEIKGKMFKYLVKEHGVKTFGIEATYAGSLYINDYIKDGIGNLDTALNKIEFWTWHTQEVKDLIKWMREYNLNKEDKDKISFYGFDMQSFNAPFGYLYDYVKRRYPQEAESFRTIISQVYDRQQQLYSQSMGPNKNAVADTLKAVALETEAWFEKNIMAKKDRNDKTDQQLRFCFQNLNEAIMLLKAKNGFSFRDSCMAVMVKKVKDLEQGKIFLWAHNTHIMTGMPLGHQLNVMGNHLKNMYGEEYYKIGLVFNKGSFNARKQHIAKGRKLVDEGLKRCEVGSSPNSSIAGQFSKLQYPSFFIDLNSSQSKLFSTRQIAYNIGERFIGRERSFWRFTPAESYDGIVFVETTNASELIPFR